jgi:ribosomal protein L7/L12
MSSYLIIALGCIAAFFVFSRLRSDDRIQMPAGSDPGTPVSIESALVAGRKIEAIKIYRAANGVGLREAKEAVEEIERSIEMR